MKKTLLLILLFISFNAYGAAPNRTYSYTPNTTIDSSQVNTNENSLYSYLQSGVDTYAASSITGAAISPAASIPYVSLSLANSILNADISSSAAIADTKLAAISTAGKVSGTALTSLASIPGGAGVIPSANIPSISLTSGVTGVLPAANGGTGTTGSLFGAWTTVSSGTSLLAATDGFVLVTANSSAAAVISILTDASDPPVTSRQQISASTGNGSAVAAMCPVRKGDHYKVTVSAGTVTVYFIALGS